MARRSHTLRSRKGRVAVTHRLPRLANTMYGLQKWYVAEYEKLGWMVLAKAKGMSGKVAQYKRTLRRMLASMEHVRGEYEDHNRRHDLGVLIMNTKELIRYVDRHL